MSKIERLHLLGSPERPNDRSAEAVQPAGPVFSPIVGYLCLFVLFAGAAGFWVAVIWWVFI